MKDNVFAEGINKVVLSANDDKRIQSTDSIETCIWNRPQVPDHPYTILIIGDFGSGKINSLFHLIIHQPDIDKIFLYAKDPYEAKHRFLINKTENPSLKHLNDSKAFTEHSNDMDDIYKNIKEYNPNKKRETLTVFDMIADMLSHKKRNWPVTELLIRGRKLNISLAFIT